MNCLRRQGRLCRQTLILCLVLLGGADVARSEDEGGATVKLNRLKDERSPYLRQHQTNPVDWYPWGDAAHKRARDEDKPIFLSIGYAACHWCHVMEHESFEDDATAKRLNETFVCVKVDREERPDLDRIYMSAVQIMTGRGGWPMTVLLLPDGRPFWGGTYLPRADLLNLVTQVETVWKTNRSGIEAQAGALAERVIDTADGRDLPDPDGSDRDLLGHMRTALRAAFDPRHGGYGTRPKFPPHTEMLFYLDPDGASDEELAQARRTLEAMAEGGIHDHVGGGFHRYSTDEAWLLPHFEKMLYDNALLMQAYAGMHARTGDPRYTRIVDRMAAWLEREMKQAGGGYASSLDADTEGEEGLTYTWTAGELEAAIGAEDAGFASSLFGFHPEGNFFDESAGARTGRNIVYLPRSIETAASENKVEAEALRARMDDVLGRMLKVRMKRAQPGLDDKVITGWNALLVSGFVRAGVDLERPVFLERANDLADFLLSACRRADGALLRFPKGSGPEIVGFCEDYVHVIAALLDLADATGDEARVTAATELTERLLAEYGDAAAGGFWTTSSARHETLFARSKESFDSPIPSDNGTAALSLLRLFQRTGHEPFEQAADRTLAAFRPMLGQPRFASMLVQLFRALALRDRMAQAGSPGGARGDVHVRHDIAQVDVFVQRETAALGARVPFLIRVELDPGWHVNANDPSAAELISTRLFLQTGAPVALEAIGYPVAEVRTLGGTPVRLFEGVFDLTGAFVVPADVPTGPRKIVLVLTFQPCDETSCRQPVDVKLEVSLRFGEQDGPGRHPALFR